MITDKPEPVCALAYDEYARASRPHCDLFAFQAAALPAQHPSLALDEIF